jgi:hypothetical protein
LQQRRFQQPQALLQAGEPAQSAAQTWSQVSDVLCDGMRPALPTSVHIPSPAWLQMSVSDLCAKSPSISSQEEAIPTGHRLFELQTHSTS